MAIYGLGTPNNCFVVAGDPVKSVIVILTSIIIVFNFCFYYFHTVVCIKITSKRTKQSTDLTKNVHTYVHVCVRISKKLLNMGRTSSQASRVAKEG